MQYFALIVLLTLVTSIVIGVIVLAMLPGRNAKARNHPYQEAVNVAGWTAMLAGGVLWPLALIWSYMTPSEDAVEPAGGSAKGDPIESTMTSNRSEEEGQ